MQHRKKSPLLLLGLRKLLPALTLLFAAPAFGQSDSLKHRDLPAVEIFSKGNIEKESSNSLLSDSLREIFQRNVSLAEKLQFNNHLFVKQYGQGTLATASFRGSNAQQIALVWEGVPIQSTLNGTSDLSLIPTAFFDQIRMESGPGSSLRGSSSMAGSLTFNNNSNTRGTGFNYYQTLSSSGIHRIAGNISHSKDRIQFRLGYAADLSKNNFLYDSLGTRVTQKHGEQIGFHLLPELNFKINEKHSFYFKSWWLQSSRELPKLLLQKETQQQQEDKVLRLVGGYKLKLAGGLLHLFGSKITEEILFLDPEINLRSKSTSDAVYAEINYEKKQGNFLFFQGFNFQHLKGISSEIGGTQYQNRGALFSSIQYAFAGGKAKGRLHLRQDFYEKKLAPFTPGLQIEYQMTQGISWSASAARIFRLPTFNDRFWIQGGNANLKAEDGYSAEGAVSLSKKIRLREFQFLELYAKLCGYTRIINNLIQWEPNGSYWSANNVYKVFSRGSESNWRVSYHKKAKEIYFGGSVNYTLATLPEDESVHENLRGKQLIYTPLYTVMNYAGISIRAVHLLFQQQYCGFRYTSSDNFQYLSPYRIYHISISKSMKRKDWEFTTQFSIQNLFDESYQVLAQRPMPGRFFQIQINLKYQHEN